MDVFSASESEGVFWYENDGNQNFTAHIINTNDFGAFNVYSKNMDGDGDIDVLVRDAGYSILWYENLGLTAIKNNVFSRIPKEFHLEQNYPNPFNPSTIIKYQIPKLTNVKIEVFNLLGQKVETLLNKPMPSGSHEVEFSANNLASGVYLYRIIAGEYQEVKKMILLR